MKSPHDSRGKYGYRIAVVGCLAIFASAAFAHGLTEEQDNRLAELIRYHQSSFGPSWKEIPASEKPGFAIQYLLNNLLESSRAWGSRYIALPEIEQHKPREQKQMFKTLYYVCASLARIQLVMHDFSPTLDEQAKKDISHISSLLLPFEPIFRSSDLDSFCSEASKSYSAKQVAELLISILKFDS